MLKSLVRSMLRTGVLLGFALGIGSAAADTVVLTGGSKLQGDVVSMGNGVYTIRTTSMGDVRVSAGSIASIQRGARSTVDSVGSAAGALGADAIQGLQSSMAQNPGVLGSIMQLQSDPEMQAILSDPGLMRAVQSFDLEALRNHPKIRALMNNARVREIQKDMQ